MVDISIIIPIYNEEANIPLLYERLIGVVQSLSISYELLFVNDGSIDQSIEIIKKLSEQNKAIRYIDFSRNFGHQIAVTAGLDNAKGKTVVLIDADLQDPPELIKDMYLKMQEGYEVVYAQRKRRAGESLLKKTTASYFYRLLSKITNVHIPVDTGDYRIMDKSVVNVLRDMPEQNKFIRGQVAWAGFRQTAILYEREQRYAGETGYTYRKMIRLALDGITAFSDLPLRLVTFLGFMVSGIAFILMLYALYSKWIIERFEPGWTSLILSVLFIGGIQMIGIGIIGEYISRINKNVRQRPLYIVKDSNLEED